MIDENKLEKEWMLEWHDWPGEEPMQDEPPFSVSVLLETRVGYAVGYYNSKRKEWMLDDVTTNQQTIIEVTAEITRWAYLENTTEKAAHLRETGQLIEWHPYPDEKPEKEGNYIVTKDGVVDMLFFSYGRFYSEGVTAWAHLLAPVKKQEI